ncbi:MAG: hypothetical protein ACP5IC_00520 [Minisyncoccia bacterium]
MKKTIIKDLAIIGLISLPLLIFAQEEAPTYVSSITDIQSIAMSILKWLYTLFFIVAAIFIILAAVGYLTAQGEEKKVEQAKKKLINAVIAIVIALLAMSFRAVIENFLRGR